jgi:hypothetical protein
MLAEAGIEPPGLDDLNTEQERALGALVAEQRGTDFFFLDRFPAAVRPFYTMPCPDDARYSNSYDVFLRGQEICSGAQRVHDPDMVSAHRPGMHAPAPHTRTHHDRQPAAAHMLAVGRIACTRAPICRCVLCSSSGTSRPRAHRPTHCSFTWTRCATACRRMAAAASALSVLSSCTSVSTTCAKRPCFHATRAGVRRRERRSMRMRRDLARSERVGGARAGRGVARAAKRAAGCAHQQICS